MFRILSAIVVTTVLALSTHLHAEAAPAKPTIAVVPFTVLGPTDKDWLGRAMQEGVATGLEKSAGYSTTIISGTAPADTPAAIALAKNSNAAGVITGSIQVQGSDLRITGQIISVATGKAVGSFKYDSPESALFFVEDLITERCQRLLTPPQKPAASAKSPAPTLELIGPTIQSNVSRYFDNNLMASIAPPADPYRDQYNKYYNQSYDTSWGYWYGGYGYGWGWGGWGWGGLGGWWGGLVYPVSAPISTW